MAVAVGAAGSVVRARERRLVRVLVPVQALVLAMGGIWVRLERRWAPVRPYERVQVRTGMLLMMTMRMTIAAGWVPMQQQDLP